VLDAAPDMGKESTRMKNAPSSGITFATFSISALAVAACTPLDWGPDQLALGNTSAVVAQLRSGREVYANYCVGCHGEKGDGEGPAARFLDPKPRDFRLGRIKFAAVSSGEAPREEDYLRILQHGLAGTAMPSFELLPEREKLAVVAYVKSFYDGWDEDGEGGAISVGKDPFVGEEDAGREEGRKVYNGLANCWSCHPAYDLREDILNVNEGTDLPPPDLRPNLYVPEIKDSQWGAPIMPPDFLFDRMKNGIEIEDLARVIASGVGGTAMPTWAGALEPEQIWGLAYYVQSIALLRGTPAARELRLKLDNQPTTTSTATRE
jgi:mono/diheme cytochrome c family protein